VVTALAARLVSEESIADQVDIMVGGLCPGAPDVGMCTEGLPGFWTAIAMKLWPGYYNADPDVSLTWSVTYFLIPSNPVRVDVQAPVRRAHRWRHDLRRLP
jgi:hypothetical protein